MKVKTCPVCHTATLRDHHDKNFPKYLKCSICGFAGKEDEIGNTKLVSRNNERSNTSSDQNK